MTRIDKYLERYLDGSITEQEMTEFRDLLESDPRLYAQLSETLELRSVLHDDLLAIEVPASLSSSVMSRVGADFAALAEISSESHLPGNDVEEEEERRRALLFPAFISGRMAGSMAVAMVMLLMIGLTPTLNPPTESSAADPSFIAALGAVANEGLPLQRSGAEEASGSEAASALSALPATSEGSRSGAVRSIRSVERGTIEGGESLSTAVATLSADLSGSPEVPVSSSNEFFPEVNTAELDAPNEMALAATEDPLTLGGAHRSPNPLLLIDRNRSLLESTLDRFDREGEVESDLDNVLADVATDPRGVTLFTFGGGEQEDLPQLKMIEPVEEKESHQRIMLGGTLASGVTSSSSGITLEGSAYLALGLGEKSRIGLEGGSATFRYSRDVQVEIITPSSRVSAARVVVRGSDGQEEESDPTGLSPEQGPRGADPGEEPRGRTAEEIDALGNRDLPQVVATGEDAGARVNRTDGYQVSYGLQSEAGEASRPYGLIFYDHTVTSLSDRLNLNGRLGVGGTDGGVVLSARAYAAISTHQNVAWTIGVGGSMLHEFEQENDFNANYGLNAGVEFGF